MSLSQRYFAGLMRLGDGAQERLYGERKRRLFTGLAPGSTVVEIGPGTGINLQYLPEGTRYVGIEPNPHMHPPLRRKAEDLGLAVELREGTAEALALPDASADAVISTLVLCSVDAPAQALAEIRRVLRPGGTFYFIEHVAASEGSARHRAQRVIKPLWRRLADDCRPDRRTAALIESAGFAEVHLDRFRAGGVLNPVRPHIAGTAVR